MRKILLSGLIISLLSSCISLNQFITTRIGEEPEGSAERFVYSLPRTGLEITFDLSKTTYLPGPYRKYTEKFLGITESIDSEKVQYEIVGTYVREFSEPDPSHYYSVNLIRGSFRDEGYFQLSSAGLVIDPMGMLSNSLNFPQYNKNKIPPFVELSMKNSVRESVDTFYKTVITDSTLVKIPILRKQKAAKTLEQKAEEAANLIIKVRKRRLKLVSGEYEVFPEGIALEAALAELNKTEQEYLELFTGRTFIENFSQSFIIIPSGGNEKIELAKFSRTKGISYKESQEGETISVFISPPESILLDVTIEEKPAKNTLYYRMPSSCDIIISEGEKNIYKSKQSMYQAGSLLALPLMKKKL